MTGIAVFRATLFTLSSVFGGLGIFFLYYSCVMTAPVADYAFMFLGTASAIAWFIEKSAEQN